MRPYLSHRVIKRTERPHVITLLLVTDESIIQKALRIGLEHAGYHVRVSESLTDAKNQLDSIDCAIVEHRLTDGSGLDLIEAAERNTPVIVMISQLSLQHGILAMRRGAFDCLTKPVDHQDLIRTIERALKDRPAPLEPGTMIGRSAPVERLKQQIGRVAPLDTTVLIGGESGTGKELVAKAIHQQSPRKHREMISVNCAAIPESLIEAELFGHVKGAFTGATDHRAGLIESAHLSTLFLDEIGELPLEAQARLLRVLQEGEIRRVGSTERTHVDVRLIAATHRNLLDMVEKGQFREDLYYRLNVIQLNCPALRERGDDLLLLAEAFLAHSKAQMERPKLHFHAEARAAMQAHPWPGNIRELQNAIERAVVLSDGPAITVDDLGLISRGTGRPTTPQFDGTPARVSVEANPSMSLEDYFQHFVLAHQDQMSETELAKRLGISRKSLWERRQRLGIPRRKDESST